MEIKGKFSVVAAAETRFAKSGNQYVTFRVAYNERVKNPDGTWGNLKWEDAQNDYDTIAEYYDVSVFADATGFDAASTLGKGDFIELTGRRALRGWIRDGQRNTAQSITANTVTVINSKTQAPEPALAGAPPF